MKRVAIVGSPGSGKSTLANHLARSFGLHHVELDSLFHRADWEPTPVPEFRAAVLEQLERPGWVVDGNYRTVSDLTIGLADTIVWLDLCRLRVTARVVWRTVRRILRREELWNGNRERIANAISRDPERSIIVWTWQHHPQYRALYGSQIEAGAWDHADTVRLRSAEAVRRWVRAIGSTTDDR